MPNTRHNKYVSVTDWFATPPTSSQTGSVQQSVSRPSPLTGGGGGGNWGSTAVPPSSGGYSLEEIQYIVETYGSGFFLRKDRDDTANGVITFNDQVKSNDFAQGNLMGAGWSIYRDGNNSVVIETDRVIVRKDMTVSELIVNQETFQKGSTIYVKAGCTLTGVEDMGTYYRCYYDNKDGDEFSGFVENDLARCQRYDKSYAQVVKYYWRKVVGVGDNYVDLSKIDGEYDGIGIPEEGDDIAQLGNTEDKTRQSAVVISPDSGGSIIIWAGINSFSLSEKNMVGMGVDSSSGKAYIYGYGDLYFGDRNQEQFINYSPEDGLHINGTLSIGTKFGDKTLQDVIDSATPDGYEEFVGNVTDELNDIKVNIDGVETSIIDLQKQLDGAIETWFYEGIPTLENAPAFNWTTDELKNAHLGDLYYNKTTGKAYRFQMDGTVYLWVEITDTDIQAAMQAANAAQDTADNKRRVFITTPYPPYDKGDLWSRGSEYPLMICVVPKESGNYVESDWDYADNLEKIKEELEQLVSDTTDDLNNAIGQATEAANNYADEGIESAKSALQSSINALNEAKANANDVYTKAEADGIINQAEEDAILAAKQQADAAIALSEEIIKAYADGIVDDEEEARIKQAEENLQAAKDYADQKANEAFAQIAGYEYLKKALNEDTTVEGGLIQTSLLKLGYTNELGQRVTMSGTNGVYNSNAIGGGIASWWGGDIYDLLDYYTWDGNKWNPKSNVTIPTNIPSGLVRFDGTGYFAKGNLWWEEDGTLHADPSALFLSFDVNAQEGTLAATILNIESTIAKFSDMWEVKKDSNGNEYLFAKRSVVTQGGLTQYSDTSGLNIDGIYDAIPIDGSTIYWDNGVLKAKYTEGSLTSITRDMVVEALGFTPYDATNPNGYITSAALNGYATQTWVNQQGFLTEHQDLSGYQPLITATNKLAYSLISGTPDLSVYLTTSSASSTYQPKITSSAKLAASLVSGLAAVATSGSYNDLSNKPTIPTSLKSPYALSWSGYSSGSYDGSSAQSITIPSNTNQLTNGAGFITLASTAKTGSIERGDIYTWCAANQTYFGSFYQTEESRWYNILSIRHRNGGSDGNLYGMVLLTSLTGDDNLRWKQHIGGAWGTIKTILDSSNYSSYALPLSGGTLTGALSITSINDSSGAHGLLSYHPASWTGVTSSQWGVGATDSQGVIRSSNANLLHYKGGTMYTIWDSGNDGSGSGLDADLLDGKHLSDILNSNVASATKLQTARSIWGQSFDGTGNVNGIIYLQTGSVISYYDENAQANREFIRPPSGVSGGANLIIGRYNADYDYALSLCGKSMVMYTGSWGSASMFINNSGNVGIGTTSPKGKLHVEGNSYLRGTTYVTNPDATTINENSGKIKFNSINAEDGYRSPYIQAIYYGNYSRKRLGIFQSNATNYTDDFVEVLSIMPNGNIGINQTSPEYKLDVTGTARITGAVTLGSTLTGNYWHLNNSSTNPYLRLTRSSVNWYVQLVTAGLQLGQGSANSCTIDASGNFLSVGGITQYSDIRKKTKLQDVELTLKQVADAPLIEHYYNSDDKKTTHVGSIAQYWAEMNNWFCKLDSDGFYTMEIQNAALASAISVARELVRYENETDKSIRLLKKRINELEDEIEKLKSA